MRRVTDAGPGWMGAICMGWPGDRWRSDRRRGRSGWQPRARSTERLALRRREGGGTARYATATRRAGAAV